MFKCLSYLQHFLLNRPVKSSSVIDGVDFELTDFVFDSSVIIRNDFSVKEDFKHPSLISSTALFDCLFDLIWCCVATKDLVRMDWLCVGQLS